MILQSHVSNEIIINPQRNVYPSYLCKKEINYFKEKTNYNEIENLMGFIKPGGGFWTSSYNSKYISKWYKFCKQNSFFDKVKFCNIYEYTGNNVFSINEKTINTFCEQYVFKQELVPGLYNFLIDINKLKSFDGLHLEDPGLSRMFSIWDCESTIWFSTNKLIYKETLTLL